MGYRSMFISCQRYRTFQDRGIRYRWDRIYFRFHHLPVDVEFDIHYPDCNKFRSRTAAKLLLARGIFSYISLGDIEVRIPMTIGVHQVNGRVIGASVLGAIMALVCVVPSSAQSQGLPDPGVGFTLGETETPVTEATIVDRFIWVGISLINRDSRYRSVPLYGYPVSFLQDDEILRMILPGIVDDTVRTARLTPSPSGENEYRGRAILYSGNGNDFQSEEGLRSLLDAWRSVTSTGTSGNDDLIAFSRPIRVDVFGGGEPPREHELMTRQGLWAAGSGNDFSPDGRESVTVRAQ